MSGAPKGPPPHPATIVQRSAARPPHPATVVQPKVAHPAAPLAQRQTPPEARDAPPRPHPATVAQPKTAPPATVAPPHPATFLQRSAARGGQQPHPATVLQRKVPHPATGREAAQGVAGRWWSSVQRMVAAPVVPPAPALNAAALAIHKAAGGDPNKSTTGIAKHADGSYSVVTQLAVGAVTPFVAGNLPGGAVFNVYATHGAGYHTEVSAEIHRKASKLAAIVDIAASQEFCPNCWDFTGQRGWNRIGAKRKANDQKWISPEKNWGLEVPGPYPYYRYKDGIIGAILTFTKKAKFDAWEALMLNGNQGGAMALMNNNVY